MASNNFWFKWLLILPFSALIYSFINCVKQRNYATCGNEYAAEMVRLPRTKLLSKWNNVVYRKKNYTTFFECSPVLIKTFNYIIHCSVASFPIFMCWPTPFQHIWFVIWPATNSMLSPSRRDTIVTFVLFFLRSKWTVPEKSTNCLTTKMEKKNTFRYLWEMQSHTIERKNINYDFSLWAITSLVCCSPYFLIWTVEFRCLFSNSMSLLCFGIFLLFLIKIQL